MYRDFKAVHYALKSVTSICNHEDKIWSSNLVLLNLKHLVSRVSKGAYYKATAMKFQIRYEVPKTYKRVLQYSIQILRSILSLILDSPFMGRIGDKGVPAGSAVIL